jgi:hypothetical protein
MSSELQISPAIHDPQGQEKQQQAAGVGILLQIMMLVLSFVLGHVLRRHKFYYLPEASASLLIGLIVGGLANISNTETSIRFVELFLISFFSIFSIIYYYFYVLSSIDLETQTIVNYSLITYTNTCLYVCKCSSMLIYFVSSAGHGSISTMSSSFCFCCLPSYYILKIEFVSAFSFTYASV